MSTLIAFSAWQVRASCGMFDSDLMEWWSVLVLSDLTHVCLELSSRRVDFNKDRSVSAKEMQRWIMEKTEEHFQEATLENKNSFRAVDPDGDGERETERGHFASI